MGLCSLFLFLSLICFSVTLVTGSYDFPPFEIQAFTPKGFKISIPHSEGVTLFAVHININKEQEYLEAGQIARDVVKRRGDRWVYEDKNLRLKLGDKLYFWLYVIVDGLGYRLDNQEYTIQKLEGQVDVPKPPQPPVTQQRPPSPPVSPPSKPSTDDNINFCVPSYTTVSGRSTCKDDVLFFEQFFSEGVLKTNNNWTSEIQIPRTPESYFVVIDNANRHVQNGYLSIKPSLLEEVYNESFIRNGHLRLKGCTSETRSDCEISGFSWNIVPPVLTSRINTKNSFNFKYGILELRAKLPKGDWIVPELWLVGRSYGPNSGRIILAKSFGNEDLKLHGKNMGGQILTQGVTTNETNSIFYNKELNQLWSDDFHTYRIEWKPGSITFKVDNMETGKLEPRDKLFNEIGGTNFAPYDTEVDTGIGKIEPRIKLFQDLGGSNLAPFDSEFYISLGVHVGGLVDFPDDSINRGNAKPWLDGELRNTLKFWQNKQSWHRTWGDHSQLLVDYVKVTAL